MLTTNYIPISLTFEILVSLIKFIDLSTICTRYLKFTVYHKKLKTVSYSFNTNVENKKF